MEQLYPLLTLFSGATIVLLGSFLLVSERELKRKREELEEIKRKQSNPSERLNAESTARIHEALDSNSAQQLEAGALRNQLAKKDHTLRNLQDPANALRAENHELHGETQRLVEEVAGLESRLQLSHERLNALSPQHEAIVEQNRQLQSRLAAAERHTEELTMKNKQLQEAVDALTNKLEAAEKSMEEFRRLQHAALADHQQLAETNQKLEQEIGSMRRELEAAQARLDESAKYQREAAERNEALQGELSNQRQAALAELEDAERHAQEERENFRARLSALEERLQQMFLENQQVSDHCARLEAEAAEHRQQLERSSSAWRPQTTQEQTADGESGATSDREQQQKLETLIGDLERELAEGKSQFEALEETHERLRAAERICQDLSNENRRLSEEIARWQERLAASEATEREVTKLRQELESLRAVHARVIEQNRQMERLEAGGDAVALPPLESDEPTMAGRGMDAVAQSSTGSAGFGRASAPAVEAIDAVPGGGADDESKPTQFDWKSFLGPRRVPAVFAGGLILVIAGAVAAKILITEAPQPPDPELRSSEAVMIERDVESSPTAAPPKSSPRLRGAFQTVRPAPVFSEPSENSALIAKLDSGIKLNVVDSRDGWLEIRSKHGRPPGFIRQEAAVRIGSN